MSTFESVVSVLESLENYFDGKSVRMNLFLKGIRHSASFTGLGRKIEVLPSSTCENLGLLELCSFYGDRDEKLVMRSPVVWQKLIDEWFDAEDTKCHFIEFDKFVLRRLLIRKDIRNSENSCKFCGSVEHDGKDCVLHPNSKKPLNFNSIPEDFYGFIDEAVCAGTTKNSTYDDED
uniref:Uncharacterized protein n=1 Tax=Ditylenchus dipsaci TaxID=166011 RepID=A0A915E4X6_9BILA